MRLNPVVTAVVRALLDSGARSATKYLGPREVVRATRRHRPSKRARTVELVVTLGQPNHRERRFVAACKRAREPFPVRKVQLRPWPKKRKEE